MPVNAKNLFAVLLLFFLLAFIGFEQAQGQAIAKPKFGTGALGEAAGEMEKLLQLEWNAQNLALKREHISINGVSKDFFAISPNFGLSSESLGKGVRAKRRMAFSNHSLSGQAVFSQDYARFNFTEKKGSKRSFEVEDNGEGQLKFEFDFDDLFIRLLQSKSGETQLIWIDGDKVEVYVGDSFSNFMKRNPEVTEVVLFPLFKRLGIKMPVGAPAP